MSSTERNGPTIYTVLDESVHVFGSALCVPDHTTWKKNYAGTDATSGYGCGELRLR